MTPTAFISPISEVRSDTDTSITFMIPIPATVNEIAAMPARASVSAVKILLKDASTESWMISVMHSFCNAPWIVVCCGLVVADLGGRISP
ncbi:MAG: hypothetical protein HYX75_07505 [Acidobacteria bacterium]|nr:hypothetical protein [Acidobacteriota bacterium]